MTEAGVTPFSYISLSLAGGPEINPSALVAVAAAGVFRGCSGGREAHQPEHWA